MGASQWPCTGAWSSCCGGHTGMCSVGHWNAISIISSKQSCNRKKGSLSLFLRFDSHATHACTLQPAASVFVSYGFVLVRVRVRVTLLLFYSGGGSYFRATTWTWWGDDRWYCMIFSSSGGECRGDDQPVNGCSFVVHEHVWKEASDKAHGNYDEKSFVSW